MVSDRVERWLGATVAEYSQPERDEHAYRPERRAPEQRGRVQVLLRVRAQPEHEHVVDPKPLEDENVGAPEPGTDTPEVMVRQWHTRSDWSDSDTPEADHEVRAVAEKEVAWLPNRRRGEEMRDHQQHAQACPQDHC